MLQFCDRIGFRVLPWEIDELNANDFDYWGRIISIEAKIMNDLKTSRELRDE